MKFEFGRRFTTAVTVATIFFLALVVGGFVLAAGAWTRSVTLSGPFYNEAGTHMYVASLRPPFRLIFDTGGDSVDQPRRSNLRLSVDGTRWTRAHTFHVELRSDAENAFSHWGNTVMFTPDKQHVPSRIDATYEVRFKRRIFQLLFVFALVAIGLRSVIAVKTGSGLGTIRLIVRGWMRGALWGSWALLAFATLYLGSIFAAFGLGYALPTAAIFKWIPGGDVLDRAMPFAAIPLLAACALGATCGWAARFGMIETAEYQALEGRLIRLWSYIGLPVIVAFLLLAASAGGWNGRFEPSHLTYQSIGDLIPYSDSQAYYSSAFEMLYSGSWGVVAAQRPLAAALRNALTLGGGMSYVGSIVLQTLLLAGALVFALRSLMAWQGIWVAGAFLALIYGLVNAFLPTSLTEPLGVFWSLLSLGLFVEALRTRSAAHAIVGFTALCLALATRMGSLFTIPFLMIWIIVVFAHTYRERVKLAGILSAILVLIILANAGLIALLSPKSDFGGNVSFAVCGLARGTNWQECALTFSSQISKFSDLKSMNNFLYAQAWQAFQENPAPLFYKIGENAFNYVVNIPHFLLGQYMTIAPASISQTILFIGFCILGLVLVTGSEFFVASFWLTMFASTIVSAAFIFDSDGRRVMMVTYTFVAGLFALAYVTPVAVQRADSGPSPSWRGGAGILVVVLATMFAAAFGLKAAYLLHGDNEKPIVETGVRQILAVPALAGFLVVPDGTPHSPIVPTVDFSTFCAMFDETILANDFGRISDLTTSRLPFSFFSAPRAERGQFSSLSLYVGPPEIVTDRAARRWSLQVSPLGHSTVLFLVDKAEVVSGR